MSPVSRSLYLVRHAIAAERGDDWPDDTLRPLTAKGISRMRQIVRGMRSLGVELDLVLTSPLVRAKQTADILMAGLKPQHPVSVTAALTPGASPAAVAEALTGHTKVRALALVGHEPGLGEFAAWLIGARAPLELRKGGVCQINVTGAPTAGSGQLVWLATPRMLRALGE